MKGIDLHKDTFKRKQIINTIICKILNISKRIFNKLKLEKLRNNTELLEINYQISGSNDDALVAMVGDKCHKLLQQAIGQNIVSNEYFAKKLLDEVKKRGIKSPIAKWGQNIFDDYKTGQLQKYMEVEDDSSSSDELDVEKLDDYLEIITSRKSIRKFLPRKVDTEIINKILVS